MSVCNIPKAIRVLLHFHLLCVHVRSFYTLEVVMFGLDHSGRDWLPHAPACIAPAEPGSPWPGCCHAIAHRLVAWAHAAWPSREAVWLTGRTSCPCTAALSSYAARASSLHRAGLARQKLSIPTFPAGLAGRRILQHRSLVRPLAQATKRSEVACREPGRAGTRQPITPSALSSWKLFMQNLLKKS
jgi:hypothetical protein